MATKSGRSRSGEARALALSPERRAEIARKAAISRWDKDLPEAEHEGDFVLGDTAISCAVLPNGTRIITQAAFLRALGLAMSTNPIFYRTKSGTKGVGYDARLLPQVAEVYLRFRDDTLRGKKEIPARYEKMIAAADLLMRALANVGIIALVDEATGFQQSRAKDALARILEEFIAKELRPWVRTFPDQFYAELFRLRGLNYPRDTVKRPRYFGHLTNDIIYSRLAPGVMEELKTTTPRAPDGRHKHQLHRRLTEDLGHPKLREHLAAVITAMQLSDHYDDFIQKLDRVRPRFGDTLPLPFEAPKEKVEPL